MNNERKEGSLDEVLALLYKGETIKLSFSSLGERETVRKILYRKKAVQDEAITILLEEDKQVLRCILSINVEECYEGQEPIYYLTCWLEKVKDKSFSFEIVPHETISSNEQKI